jgi:hypothetical protein
MPICLLAQAPAAKGLARGGPKKGFKNETLKLLQTEFNSGIDKGRSRLIASMGYLPRRRIVTTLKPHGEKSDLKVGSKLAVGSERVENPTRSNLSAARTDLTRSINAGSHTT